jgi:ribulose-phosphate 3-epimerase
MKIVPAILAKNKKEFLKQWQKVAPFFSYLQIDIMDGKFVKNKTDIKPNDIKKIITKHDLEIHLMVNDVSKYITLWETLPNVKKIIWHYEAVQDIESILCLNDYLKKGKIKTGLAINPETHPSQIIKVAKYFDTIQIMGVNPGAQGKIFHSNSLNKIKILKKKYPKQKIAIDGGVDAKNFLSLKKAGADIIILGHYLQKSSDIKQALKNLK